MHNYAFVTLTGHPEKNGDIVVKNLKSLKQMQPQGQKIELRSDSSKEFYYESRMFCIENNIHLHFIPKGSLWLQAFIERGFSNYKRVISKPYMDWGLE